MNTLIEALIPTACIVVGLFIYLLPTVIVTKRKVVMPDCKNIFLINLFIGWTIIFWVVSLLMAISAPKDSPKQDRKTISHIPTATKEKWLEYVKKSIYEENN